MKTNWYSINNVNIIDTPALLIYPDRIQHNIDEMINSVGEPQKLWPHVKTYKMKEVVEMQMANGIRQFKCSTIAEAEMLAMVGVPEILLAYQAVGPKQLRLLQLIQKYSKSKFSTLVDNNVIVKQLSDLFNSANLELGVFIDIDNGLHRTGIQPNAAVDLYQYCLDAKSIIPRGLHVYDGHHRESNLADRTNAINEGFLIVDELLESIKKITDIPPITIVGGTPSFPIHAKRAGIICSPGTALLWDWGYGTAFKEMDFQFAGLVLARIISKPGQQNLCVDLGHKAVAADKPLPRIHFLNLPEGKIILHSEEHLVIEVADNSKYEIGMVLYGVPVHICPSVALYEEAYVIRNHEYVEQWKVVARKRKITI